MASCVVVCTNSGQDDHVNALLIGGAMGVDCDSTASSRVILTAWFDDDSAAADMARALRVDGVHATVGPMSPRAAGAWERHTAPVVFAPGCCVCFPWSKFAREGYDEVIEIDPGAGFGAGRHPSTQLVLRTLDTAHEKAFVGQRVLDVGCGSGVLSVALANRGAEVVAIDIAPAAIQATKANATLNAVGGNIVVSDAALSDFNPASFDHIVANIHAPVLASMAGDFDRLLRPDGYLTVSGFSPGQVSALTTALGRSTVIERSELDGWVAQILR